MPTLPDNWMGVAIGVGILLVIAWAVDRIVLKIVRGVVRRMAARTRSTDSPSALPLVE